MFLMRTQWITSWILWLGHHKMMAKLLVGLVGLVSLVSLSFQQGSSAYLFSGESFLVFASMLVMSIMAIKLLDSFKTALLLLFVMCFLYMVSAALLLVLGVEKDEFTVLARVVVVTLMMSHLIHFLTALLKEMARGLHQFDAVVEALALTHQPILLSSLTTILGFVIVAIFDNRFDTMATQVLLGVGLSYIATLSLVPLILLSVLLEFRVGHTEDRHGLAGMVKFIQARPPLAIFGKLMLVLMFFFIMFRLWQILDVVAALVTMLVMSFILLLLAWQKIFVAGLAVLIAFVSVIFPILIWVELQDWVLISSLVLLVPIGIVLDDVVHFFTRYHRAERLFLVKPADKVKFAINSVGRSIWLTSQLLMAGLAVLLFSNNTLVIQAVIITLLALLMVSFILLWLLPAVVSVRE